MTISLVRSLVSVICSPHCHCQPQVGAWHVGALPSPQLPCPQVRRQHATHRSLTCFPVTDDNSATGYHLEAVRKSTCAGACARMRMHTHTCPTGPGIDIIPSLSSPPRTSPTLLPKAFNPTIIIGMATVCKGCRKTEYCPSRYISFLEISITQTFILPVFLEEDIGKVRGEKSS